MNEECPKCSGKTGYQVNTVERLCTWYEWNKEAIDTNMKYISGGIQKKCMDCGKIIKEHSDD